ncbi:MAG: hypothetical protein R2932_20940 [Caldilineaceae bacterium]
MSHYFITDLRHPGKDPFQNFPASAAALCATCSGSRAPTTAG